VGWSNLDQVTPRDFTIHTAAALVAKRDLWVDQMPKPQPLSPELVDEGHTIPLPRVQAMHEGKRRARARRNHPG
jgi:hypothetical protein